MAGEFNSTVLPALAGSYFNWEAEGEDTPAVGLGGIVALVGTHNWGPVNSATLYTSPRDFVDRSSPTTTTATKRVFDAFKGEGRPGKGGATAVLHVRVATAAAAPATRVLVNTAVGAPPALTLTGRFPGTFANDLRATVQAGVAAGTNELLLLLSGRVIARYVHTATDIAGLAAEINEIDPYVTATVNADGVALATVASVAFAGGNDGAVLTAVEHAAAQDLLTNTRFSVAGVPGLVDPAIRTSWSTWTAEQNRLGKRFFFVAGGVAGESLATANTRSRAFNNKDLISLGVGTLRDDDRNEDVSTADLVARVAGAVAARGERRDLIYARFTGLSVSATSVLPTLVGQESALAAGTTVFSRDTNATPVFIREGVTSYADDSASPRDRDGNKTRPVSQYRRIKNLRIQHGVEMAVDEWATSGDVLGDLPNNERARGLILGRFQEEYATREEAEIVQPGWTVALDPSIPQSDDSDFAAFLHGFHPTRSLRQMLNTVRMG